MKITYWSDIACPFCYIGSTRLKRALKELGLGDTKLNFKAFQLDPNAPKETTATYLDHFTGGDDSKADQVKQQMTAIANMGKQEGLTMNMDQVVPTNTMDAHRLIKLAKDQGDYQRTQRLIDRLYQVYFVDCKSIADHGVLLQAATEVGLDAAAVKDVLNSDKYHDEVVADEQEAVKLGAHGVPFFVFDDQFALSGAQPYEIFVKAINHVLEQEDQSAE